jgi:hypothetical protein
MKTTENPGLNLFVEKAGNRSDAQEIVIRHGEALPLRKPQQLVLYNTAISGPADYFEQRNSHGLIDAKLAVVGYSFDLARIQFYEDMTNTDAAIVIGSLTLSTELHEFGINTAKTWELTTLRDFLRIRRHLFADRDAHTALMQKLNEMRVKSTQNLENTKDTRGNASSSLSVKTESDVPLDFTLAVPLFIGGDKHTVRVEIGFELRSAGMSFWFLSDELPELLDDEKRSVIETELARFRKAKLAVIHKQEA